MYPLRPGEETPEQFGGVSIGSDIEETIQMLLALSAETQISDSAGGGGQHSGMSGFLQSQLTELAKTGYHQIPDHAARAFEGYFGWVLEMIDTTSRKPVILPPAS